MHLAFIREPSPSIGRCELTFLQRDAINFELLKTQHQNYVETLQSLGTLIERFPPAPDCPDGVFVEDLAVLLPELTILCRPGITSRLLEVKSSAEVLKSSTKKWEQITAPGTLEGGDVLLLGKDLYVGMGARTNGRGIEQLSRFVEPYGYRVLPIPTLKCLHLKTAVTALSPEALVFNPAWVERSFFADFRLIETDPREAFAGNVLRVGSTVLCNSTYPRTLEKIVKTGVRVLPIDFSEFAKAEAGLTCCSLIF